MGEPETCIHTQCTVVSATVQVFCKSPEKGDSVFMGASWGFKDEEELAR